MENELRAILLSTAEQYAAVANCALSTVSRRCRAENGFFARIAKAETSFTVRTYDETMAWFATHWPDGADLPAHLRRYVKPLAVPASAASSAVAAEVSA